MRVLEVTIRGIAPLSGSKAQPEKPKTETHAQYEARVWPDKFSYVGEHVALPELAIKKSLISAAKFLKRKIPGARGATYSSRFTAGLQPVGRTVTNVKRSEVYPETLMCSSDGSKAGTGGSRVARTFPMIREGWTAKAKFVVFDPELTNQVISDHLSAAGNISGLGRWRPENGGCNGLFEVLEIVEVE